MNSLKPFLFFLQLILRINGDSFPVYLRIGVAGQLVWVGRYDDIVDRCKQISVQFDAAIIEGASLIFSMNWNRLEAWLDTVQRRLARSAKSRDIAARLNSTAVHICSPVQKSRQTN